MTQLRRVKADILAGQLQLRGILVANRQPKCARRLQQPMHSGNPAARPVQVFGTLTAVVVNVVVVADVERRVGKRQIHAASWQVGHQFQAVAMDDRIERHLGGHHRASSVTTISKTVSE